MEIKGLNLPLNLVFTVLRDPVSRCISWYQMVCNKVIDPMVFFSEKGAGIVSEEQFIQNCFNRMTYQIGDYADITKRSKNEEEVLNNAKENLKQMKDVILFENLGKNIESVNLYNLSRKRGI